MRCAMTRRCRWMYGGRDCGAYSSGFNVFLAQRFKGLAVIFSLNPLAFCWGLLNRKGSMYKLLSMAICSR